MSPKRPIGCPVVSVIICTLNEEANLPHVLPKIPDWVDEILLVDAHSEDATVEIAKQLCPRIRVLYQTGKGKGDALKLGINEAKGEIIVTIDADDVDVLAPGQLADGGGSRRHAKHLQQDVDRVVAIDSGAVIYIVRADDHPGQFLQQV